VSPWNGGVEKRRGGDAPPPEAEPHVSLVDWLAAKEDELVERYERLFVPKNDGRYLRRNAPVALGNTAGAEQVTAPEGFVDGDDALLREHAAWAAARIEEREGE